MNANPNIEDFKHTKISRVVNGPLETARKQRLRPNTFEHEIRPVRY